MRGGDGGMHVLYTGVRLKPPPPQQARAASASAAVSAAAQNGAAQAGDGQAAGASDGPFATAERMAAMFSHLTESQDLDDYAPHEPMKESVMLASALHNTDAGAQAGNGKANGEASASASANSATQQANGSAAAHTDKTRKRLDELQQWSAGRVVIAGPPELSALAAHPNDASLLTIVHLFDCARLRQRLMSNQPSRAQVLLAPKVNSKHMSAQGWQPSLTCCRHDPGRLAGPVRVPGAGPARPRALRHDHRQRHAAHGQPAAAPRLRHALHRASPCRAVAL